MTTRRKMLAMTAASAIGAGTFSMTAHAQGLPQVTLYTSKGAIVIEVDTKQAPLNAANFLQYVREGYYSGTIFHRVISNFMIQGGGMTSDMQPKPTARGPIQLETSPKLLNRRGTIAMARTSDPNSATSQFFINVADNPSLDAPKPDGYGYAVFGRVIEGMNVVDEIRKAPIHAIGPHQNVPQSTILIERAEVTQK